MKLPSFAKKYFWEVDVKRLDPAKKPVYVLKRIMEYGDPKAIRWARRVFPVAVWKKSVVSRGISKRTRNFWSSILYHKK